MRKTRTAPASGGDGHSGFDGPYTQASAFSAALFVLRARLVTAPDWTPVRVELQGEPLHLRQSSALACSGPTSSTGSNAIVIHVDAETANRPIVQADPRMRHILQSVSQHIHYQRPWHRGRSRRKSKASSGACSPTGGRRLKMSRCVLGCSPRTLQSRLTQCGTSFEHLLNDIRRTNAEDLLRLGSFSMSQISGKLGFSELSAFTRAAQRWFGMSPSAYRKKIKG